MEVIAMIIFSIACAKTDVVLDYMPAGLYLTCGYNNKELTKEITFEDFQTIYTIRGEIIESESDVLSDIMIEYFK